LKKTFKKEKEKNIYLNSKKMKKVKEERGYEIGIYKFVGVFCIC